MPPSNSTAVTLASDGRYPPTPSKESAGAPNGMAIRPVGRSSGWEIRRSNAGACEHAAAQHLGDGLTCQLLDDEAQQHVVDASVLPSRAPRRRCAAVRRSRAPPRGSRRGFGST